MISKALISPRLALTNQFLWRSLFYVCLTYNFHRYIFKYSHGAYAKDGYQQTPLAWQVGKFVLVAVFLSLIYVRSRFVGRINAGLLSLYGCLTIVLLTNLGSLLLYGQLLTDEIEYVLYGFMLLPLAFMERSELSSLTNQHNHLLNTAQYVIIGSNFVVIAGYFIFRIIPFHAYEGILLRFGGLWDDPNTLAIISVFLLGYALFAKQYVLAGLHVLNVLLTISFNGYLLLFTLAAYFFLNTNKHRIARIGLFAGFIGLVALLVFTNYDLIYQLYEAKRGSVEQHTNLDLGFSFLPLYQPVQFHETWWISLIINYFPFSVPVVLWLVWTFVRFFFVKPKSLQRLLFILFCVTNLFLPFLYMFPINFLALLYTVLYLRNVRF